MSKDRVKIGASTKPATTGDIKTGMTHGSAKEGLAAFLLCHKKRFKVGDRIPLSYGIVLVGLGLDKESEETYKLRIRVFRPEYALDPGNYSWFEVTGPDGQKVPYRGSYDSIPLYSPSDKNSSILHHGDFLGRTYRDLGEDGRFNLSRPGLYKVRWGYVPHAADGVWSGGKLMSDTIEFEIVK